MVEHIHVGVCIPSSGNMSVHTALDLIMMSTYFEQHRIKGCKTQKLSIFPCVGSMLVANRHTATKNALKAGCTHLLYIDTDMLFPRNLIHKLIIDDKDIVAANCTTRVEPIMPIAHKPGKVKVFSKGKTGLEEVELVGMAVMMVRRDVFKHISPPLFMMEWIPEMQNYCGEDAYFAAKVQEVGYKIYIDHDISQHVKHIGEKIYGHEHTKEKE